MKTFHNVTSRNIAAALLLLGSTTTVYAQVPGGGLGAFGGELRGETRVEGKVLCVGCSVAEVQQAHPDLNNLYLLKHGQQQAVLAVTFVSDPQRWAAIVFPRELHMRSPDALFHELTAEQNLWKKVEIEGLLRSDRVLDVFGVTVQG
ncbi:MAG: hypothetical protein AB7P69_10770 [Candidatus Binatia bacterium]